MTDKKTFPIARYHIMWVVLYILLLGGSTAFASYLYTKHDEDRLPAGFIELTLDKEKYELGDTVSFTVINHFPTSVFITNHCPKEPLNVYQWKNDTWLTLHAIAGADGHCYGQERRVAIPPEGSRGYDFSDWPTLFTEPGVYRIAMVVENYSEVPFKDFVVLAPPEIITVEETVTTPTKPTPTAPIIVTTPVPNVVVTPVESEVEQVVEDVFEYEDNEREEEEEDDD